MIVVRVIVRVELGICNLVLGAGNRYGGVERDMLELSTCVGEVVKL